MDELPDHPLKPWEPSMQSEPQERQGDDEHDSKTTRYDPKTYVDESSA